MGWLSLAVVLLYFLNINVCTAQRILIKYDVNAETSVSQRAKALGLAPVRASPVHGLLVVENKQHIFSKHSKQEVAGLLGQINAWPEVILAEEDQPRYMHRPLKAAAPVSVASATGSSRAQQGDPYLDCTNSDTPLSNSTVLPEYQPYGPHLIQAGPNSSKLPNRTDDKGVLICIIDSGLDIGHPDMENNSVDGCRYEDAFAPAGCPFEFGRDYVSHGTHIAGTIAAQKNGVGVIGVIPGPAEVYVVRVFNDSGDVNQGQGLVYGSTLILAFTQCEGRLSALQAAQPQKNYRMVVSMSLGAAGPLSIEKMFFREALQRGDIIFVASSGNNGTAETMIQGQLTASINPGNYPGSYDEVIAIAAVDCSKQLAAFSQKNPTVDLAAPGVNILSLASRDYPLRTGLMAGGFMSDNPKIYIPGGIASSENQVRFSGSGKVKANVIDCGTGSAPCPNAKGNICLVQYDPQLQPMENAPGKTGIRGSVFSQMALATFGAEAAPVTGVPEKLVVPGKFYCDVMEFCMKAGAKAVLLGSPAISTGFYGSYSMQEPASFYDLPLLANLDCSELNCTCWKRIGGASKTLPTAGLSLGQYTLVKSAVANATKSGKALAGTVESQEDAYQRLSGTSMAVPHASGAIARVWAAYPYCNSTTIRTALEQTALDLGPKGKDVMYGHGLVQAEAAFDYLRKQPCAQGWQSADMQQQTALLQGVTSSQASTAVKAVTSGEGVTSSQVSPAVTPGTPGEGVTSSNQAGGGVTPVVQQMANTSKPATVSPVSPVMASPAVTGVTTSPTGRPLVPPTVPAGVVTQVQLPTQVQKSDGVTPKPTTSVNVWTITTDGNVVVTRNPSLQPAYGTVRQTVVSQSQVTPVTHAPVTPAGQSPVTLASSYVSNNWMPKTTRGLKQWLGLA